jgi:hypothetical protein
MPGKVSTKYEVGSARYEVGSTKSLGGELFVFELIL